MYTVKKLADSLGVGTDVIRHYTDIGLVTPVVNSETGYRYYDENDALAVANIRVARSLNFSLPQAQELQKEAVTDQIGEMERQEAEISSEISMLQNKLRRLREVRVFLQKTQLCNGTVQDVERNAIHSIYTIGLTKDYAANKKVVGEWMEKLPYTHISVKLPKAELNDAGFAGPYSVELGVGVTEEYAKELELNMEPPVESIPGGRCLILYIKTRDILGLGPKDVEPLLAKSRELGMPFLNDSSGRLLAIEETPEGPLFYILIRCRIA